MMGALLVVILLRFVLGMRHATDTNPVVTIATIVSRERTMLRAMAIDAV